MQRASAPTGSDSGHSIGRLASYARLFFGAVPRRLQVAGLVLVLGASLTEGISISLLGPLLALTGEPAAAERRTTWRRGCFTPSACRCRWRR